VILSHTVKKRTVTLRVVVPSAGRLTASGRGLTRATKATSARRTVTLTLKAAGHGKLQTRIKLAFVPARGRKLNASLAATIKR
jgi:hypothetical protein